MPVYKVSISKSVSPEGLGSWYARKFDGFFHDPKRDVTGNTFNLEVNPEDCDDVERALADDPRVTDFQVKE